MKKFFSVNSKFWQILILLVIAFGPTSFLLKKGIFLNGDAVFPIDSSSEMSITSPFFTWREGDFGSDFWEHNIFFPLRTLIYSIFGHNYDFTQFIYYFFIFSLGALGIYYLAGFFFKNKTSRFLTVMIYLVNFWTIMRFPHNYLLQSYFLIPLLLYLYLRYLQKGEAKYLFLHTLIFPFLGALHGYWLYFLILLIWNAVNFIYSGKNYKKEFFLSLKVALLGFISLSFLSFPISYVFLRIPENSLFSSKEFFANSFAFTFYSQDQNVFNSLSLLSPLRFFDFIDGGQYSLIFLKLLFIVVPFLLSTLLISFFLVFKKLNKYFLFLIILFLTGIFLSSFHFISQAEFIRKVVFIIYPPLSIDTNTVLPLVAIPFSIMIGFSLEHLSQLRKEKFIKYFLTLPVLLLFFGLIFLINNSSQFAQVTNEQLKKVTRFREKLDENSYLLVYPILTMFQLNDLPYPIYNVVFFNHQKQISFMPIQTTLPRTRNFTFPEINLENKTFNPNILRQLGIGQIMLVKNAKNVDYRIYQKIVNSLIAFGYKVIINDEDGLLMKTDDYKPNLYVSRFLIFSDSNEISQFNEINNFEDKERSVLFKNDGLFIDKDNFKKLYLFYQDKGNFYLGNSGFYEIKANSKNLKNNKNSQEIIIDNFKIDKLPFTIELKDGSHNYKFSSESFNWLSIELKNGNDDPVKIENVYHSNPTSFKAILKADKSFWFVFNESFQSGWQAYLKPYNKEKFKKGGLASISFIKNIKEGIPLNKHFLVNGFSNGWYVSKDDLEKINGFTPGLNEFEIELIYKPQVFYEVGGLITIIFLFSISCFLIKSLFFRKK